jgi:bifunctional enzyme CysN/CysC
LIGRERVLEIFCTAPMEVLRARDQSGAYKLADEGKISQMPGVTATFEEPSSPDLVLNTEQTSVEESVEQIVQLMTARGYLPSHSSGGNAL